jgi:DTW domain-containing protein YfiP
MPDRIDKDELLTANVKILLLMHHKEYLNAGNSAKSLIALLPTEYLTLYVYGREGDFDRCIDEMMINHGRHTAILWPGESAISVEEFISSTKSSDETMMESERNDGSSANTDNKKQDIEEGDDDEEETTDAIIRIVALDGTYKNAKNMYKTIRQRLGEKGAQQDMPSCIALHPKSVSKFHRAKKNYGTAIRDNNKLDERALRVSTAEACALLLTELGAAESVQEKIIKALLVNNCNRN